MEVFRLSVGQLETNCYLAYDEATKDAIVIDPGDDGALILAEIEKRALKVNYIVNTHGHWDHVGANTMIAEATGAPLLIHEEDNEFLANPQLSIMFMQPHQPNLQQADRFLSEGDTVEFGNCSLRVIFTPGHTKGGICLYGHTVLFSGDTLFQGSIGRSDFPGGDGNQLIANIKEKLLILPDDTTVCPGHGGLTTIGAEKRDNYFLK